MEVSNQIKKFWDWSLPKTAKRARCYYGRELKSYSEHTHLTSYIELIDTVAWSSHLELVVFAASLKFFFIEGGEQFIVGAQTAKTIGLEPTLKITLAGVSFAAILFFLLFYSHALIPTRWLEFALAITLYFFAATMFKEVFEKESDETKELDEKAHKYGYITIVSLESVENAIVLAALTFIDISGALIGAFISISAYIVLAINSKRFLTRIPLKKLRLIAAILLTIIATPLIIYSTGFPTPNWLHWVIPPLR